MMKQYLVCLVGILSLHTSAQIVADFENVGISDSTYLRDAGPEGFFASGNILLPNNYTDAGTFDFWDGWAISNVKDNQTPGFINEGSAITGMGVDSSSNYAVTFVSGSSTILLADTARGQRVKGMYITNNTYAALSMRDGDGFAKAFGGESGDDPDYFLLTIHGWSDGVRSLDSVNFYLADYRFEDNSQDYIVQDWRWVELSSLGGVDSIVYRLSSTDIGDFGMNTPAYFCVDNIETVDLAVHSKEVDQPNVLIYPNPTDEIIYIQGMQKGSCLVMNTLGQQMSTEQTFRTSVSVVHLPAGTYYLLLRNEDHLAVKQFIKI